MKSRFKKGDVIKCVQYDFPGQQQPRINFMEVATVDHSEDGTFYGDGEGNYCEESDAYLCDDEGNVIK